MNVRVRLRKVGTSLVITIPKPVQTALSYKEGDHLLLYVGGTEYLSILKDD